MKKVFNLGLLLSAIFFASIMFSQQIKEKPIKEVINEALNFSAQQSLLMANSLKDKTDLLPKTVDLFGNLITCKSDWWTSGFFPGQLWYLYEFSSDPKLKTFAEEYSTRVEKEKFATDTHDLGFVIHCSFGNGYRITSNNSYLEVIHTAANSLSTRFNQNPGVIRSWDTHDWNKQWQYAVIIDNMMNLEMLLWASEKFNEPKFREIAISHADKTLLNHFREDNSSYHVVSYDTVSGIPHAKNTAQGFSHSSAWARGQSWGLYGYVVMYRFTKEVRYLKQANSIAVFLINHPRMPKDKLPYWDYDAPNIPDTYRDASAGAVMCSALIELSKYADSEKAKLYLSVAEQQLRSLNTYYRNAAGNNGNFILKHSVGSLPGKSEVDVPLTYADYYFVEALMRMRELYK
ncbi:MAG: glycoside hydrolase family 88 protein [Ignavibacteria bacterium]|nr:glycoside hydrolase family 88 protein [Ignavibacteria bacterium]